MTARYTLDITYAATGRLLYLMAEFGGIPSRIRRKLEKVMSELETNIAASSKPKKLFTEVLPISFTSAEWYILCNFVLENCAYKLDGSVYGQNSEEAGLFIAVLDAYYYQTCEG